MSTRKGSSKGTHGSLTKAGRIRDQSPVRNWRIDSKTGGKVLTKTRKGKKGQPMKGGSPKRGRRKRIARVRNRQRYKIATMCPACSGTHPVYGIVRTPIKIGARKCWKCGARLIWKGLRPTVRKQRGKLPRRFS